MFWAELWEAFTQAIESASGVFATAGGIAFIDSPVPGPADLVALAIVGVTVVACAGVAVYNVATATPSITSTSATYNIKSSEDSKSKSETSEKAIYRYFPKNQAIFPFNPYVFCPIGLQRDVYKGSGNGAIIKWHVPGIRICIFEWDEDLKYGQHYHVMTHDGTHYLPGDFVPEPWNTLYFSSY